MNISPSEGRLRELGDEVQLDHLVVAPAASATATDTTASTATTPTHADQASLPHRSMSTERQGRLQVRQHPATTLIITPDNLSPGGESGAGLRGQGRLIQRRSHLFTQRTQGLANLSRQDSTSSLPTAIGIAHRRSELLFDENHLPPPLRRTRQIRDDLEDMHDSDDDSDATAFVFEENVASPIPLEESVADWCTTDSSEALAALQSRWRTISAEDGAAVFGEFLVKLNGDNINAGSKLFRQQTADLLDQIGNDPELRKQVFDISVGATAECEDLVSHTMVIIQTAVRADRFKKTVFATDAEAVLVQRQFHRLDLLHELAQKIVDESNNKKEAIETHLHVMTRHVEALKLTELVPAIAMRWDMCSKVSPERSAEIPGEIKWQENERFAGWLAHSPSWLDYIARNDKPRFDSSQDARDTLFETEFQQRLDTRLGATGLNKNDAEIWADAERTLGKAVSVEMLDEVNTRLTRDFLVARGNPNLLNKYWPDHECTGPKK